MSILAQFPTQVQVLRGTREVEAMLDVAHDPAERLISRDATAEFPRYCALLPRAEAGEADLQAQLLALGEEAKAQFDRVDHGLREFGEVVRNLESVFSDADIRALRSGGVVSDEFFDELSKHAMLMAGFLMKQHPDVLEPPPLAALPDSFLFRSAVVFLLRAVLWISVGGAEKTKTERLRNDLVDANLVTYATYFDGFLSNDRRASGLFELANPVVRRLRNEMLREVEESSPDPS